MSLLQRDFQNGVLTIRLNRPDRANALNLEMVKGLQKAISDAASDSQTRAILLTGSGRNFCAGHDISEMLAVSDEPVSYQKHLQQTYNPLIKQIRRIEKPVVAVINGPAAGAGLGIALACDLRLAADSATFTVGFSGIGLVPDSGVSLFLPLLIGLGRATWFTFSNIPITAAEALEWGMVTRIIPEAGLIPESISLAEQLVAGPVGVFGMAKRAFNEAVLSNLEQTLEFEAQMQVDASRGAEHREGLTAFLEKRRPKFD